MPDERAKALFDRLEHYGFECEAGPLRNCVEWQSLKELAVSEKKKVGLIAGVFDLVHAGHVLALRDAREQCDYLIVALHFAPTLGLAKSQPVMSVFERQIILRACRHVDEVACYHTERELLGMMTERHVEVRFLGEEYKSRPITGADLSIETRFLSREHGLSTSELRSRVYAAEIMRLGGARESSHAVR